MIQEVTMYRRIPHTAAAMLLAAVIAAPAAAQEQIARGTSIGSFTLTLPNGQSATGQVSLLEPFTPSPRGGVLAIRVGSSDLQRLIARLHDTKGSAHAVMEISGLKMEVDVIELSSMKAGSTEAHFRVGPVKSTRAAAPRAVVMQATPQRELDASRLQPATRQGFSSFWQKQSPREAAALERRLGELEERARRGENVQREATHLVQQHPELVQLTAQLSEQPLHLVGSGGTDEGSLECQGIGWIGMNGKLRCIGKLVVNN
jgi:hypothetical protein